MSNIAEDRAKERQLTRIATRGVTQLFNAVAQRQDLIDKKLQELEKAKDRSKKRKLVEDLKSNDFQENFRSTVEVKSEDEIKQESDFDDFE